MSSEERNAVGAIISFMVTIWIFGRPIWAKTTSGAYAAADGLQDWGRDVLWLMGGGIVITIVAMILFHIILSIVTGDTNPQMITDERDRAISRIGSIVSLVGASGGFISAVIALALGMEAVFAFNCVLVGMTGGAIASEVLRVALYRLGF